MDAICPPATTQKSPYVRLTKYLTCCPSMRNTLSVNQATKYIPGIDGIRAVAILLVLAFHATPSHPLSGGYVGADVFFVLSGAGRESRPDALEASSQPLPPRPT